MAADVGGAAVEASQDNAAPVAANDNGDLGAEDLDALTSAVEGDAPAPTDTVRIGEHDVPFEVLQAAMADDGIMQRLTRKLKVDGEEVEVSFADALQSVPLAKGAQKRMWEAAQQRKQVEQLVDAMKRDPLGIMERVLGGSDAVYKAVADRLEYEGMPPEDRARLDEERELRRKAGRADEYEKAEQERELAARTAKLQQTYAEGIRGALEAGGVRVSPHAVARTAMVLDAAIKDGVLGADITQADYQWAASRVAEELDAERSALIPDDVEGDALIESVGEARARRIAQAYAARVRARQTPVKHEPANDNGGERRAKREAPQTWEDWFAQADRKMGIRR